MIRSVVVVSVLGFVFLTTNQFVKPIYTLSLSSLQQRRCTLQQLYTTPVEEQEQQRKEELTTKYQPAQSPSRRRLMQSVGSILVNSIAINNLPGVAVETNGNTGANNRTVDVITNTEVKIFQLPSGLRYIELVPGNGLSPSYGQLCVISYDAYIKLPVSNADPKPTPQKFDAASGYILKHGSGRVIAGLDEGLHTLQIGGKRRILIPPKLGYVDTGLGPLPEYPWNRWKLNRLLEQMVAQVGGTLILDVTLLDAHDDEADQGYYSDNSLSTQDFDLLRTNLQQKAATAQQGRKL